jgi:predicted nucleic acid-binding protein
VVATSRVAYAEAIAAFARKLRKCEFTSKAYRQVWEDLRRDWNSYFLVEVTQQLVELAGELARHRGLRGFDAVHLASVILLRRRAKAPSLSF